MNKKEYRYTHAEMFCHVWLSATPMDCGMPGSTVYGVSQTRILKWGVISFSRESSLPRNQTCVSCLADTFFTTWEAQINT